MRPDIAGPDQIELTGQNSPAIVCADTVMMGMTIKDFSMMKKMPAGNIRGYDVRTGEKKWVFNTVPQEGEVGVETWMADSWRFSGNTNVWAWLSCDEETGWVYLPLGTPTSDYYGGHRPGNNLFAESLVALDAATGERKWHFQAVRHGLWDYDFPCAPNLIDVEIDGKKIKAIAQVSKQGFTYVFDRTTGEPLWPIEDRVVAESSVPGEWTSPNQPFPTKPPPFDRQGFTEDDLIDLTPELAAEALEMFEKIEGGPALHTSDRRRSRRQDPYGAVAKPGRRRQLGWCCGRSLQRDPLRAFAHSGDRDGGGPSVGSAEFGPRLPTEARAGSRPPGAAAGQAPLGAFDGHRSQ